MATRLLLGLLLVFIPTSNGISLEGKPAKLHLQPKHVDLLRKCDFPDEIPMKIFIEDVFLDINLSVNQHLSEEKPVYVMSGDGSIFQEDLKSFESFRAYHDQNNIAAIVIECSENKEKPFTLEGKITHQDNVYSLNPGQPHHRHTRDTSLYHRDYILSQSSSLDFIDFHPLRDKEFLTKPDEETLHRSKRNEKPAFIIDVVIITDYTIYNDWYSRDSHPHIGVKRIGTLNNIRKYYTVSYNWVNLIYSNFPAYDYTITINVVGFIISDTANTSVLTEPLRKGNKVWGLAVLKGMETYLESVQNFPDYDHVQLFSRFDFTEDEAMLQIGNKGKSYIGSVCSGAHSVSYVEELGGFNSADISAHELGHSFGANHDGIGNWCKLTSTYLMAAMFNPHIARSNIPSDCTLFAIKRYMMKQLEDEPECMLEKITPLNDVPNLKDKYPGELFTVDEQCQQVHGKRSFYCRSAVIADANDFCYEEMNCFDPIQETCVTIVPALGTSCGNKSWCMNTECTFDDRAPARDVSCLFGDVPYGYYEIAGSGESCEQRVRSSPNDCYDDFFRAMCCESCAKIKNAKEPGCEYGDRIRRCMPFMCGHRVYMRRRRMLYDIKCCYTCAHRSDHKHLPRRGRKYRFRKRKQRRKNRKRNRKRKNRNRRRKNKNRRRKNKDRRRKNKNRWRKNKDRRRDNKNRRRKNRRRN